MSIDNKVLDILKEGEKIFILRDMNNSNSNIHNIAVTGRISKIKNENYPKKVLLSPYVVSSVNGKILFSNESYNTPKEYECDLNEQGLYFTKDINEYLSEFKKEILLNGNEETVKNKLYYSEALKI